MKNNKGFTLVELLTVIVILSLVLGITAYVAIGVINKTKEKSYQVSINNIKQEASNYVLENSDKIKYIKSDNENYEYQCVTIRRLIDYGYLKKDVTKSLIAKDTTVSTNDYILVERNNLNKAIAKTEYILTDDESNAERCEIAMNAYGTIGFSTTPDKNEWSREKIVTIKYTVNNVLNTNELSEYLYTYSFQSGASITCQSGCTDTDNIKVLKVTGDATIEGAITKSGDPSPLITKKYEVSNFDNVGPKVDLEEQPTSTTEISNGFVSIGLITSDVGSGVDTSSFTAGDITVTIGGNQIDKVDLFYVEDNKYRLNIQPDDNEGELLITIAKNGIVDRVIDTVKNGNDKTPLDPMITIKKPANPVEQITKNYIIFKDYHCNEVVGYSDTLANAVAAASESEVNVIALNTAGEFTDNGATIPSNKTIILNTNYKKLNLTSSLINEGNLTLQGNSNTSGILSGTLDNLIVNKGTLSTSYIYLENKKENSWVVLNTGTYLCQDATTISATSYGIAATNGGVYTYNGCNISSNKDGISAINVNNSNAAPTIEMYGGSITSSDTGIRLNLAQSNLNMHYGSIAAKYGIVAEKGNATITGNGPNSTGIIGYNTGVYITNGNVVIGENDNEIDLLSIHIGSTHDLFFSVGVLNNGGGSWKWYDGTLWGKRGRTFYNDPADKAGDIIQQAVSGHQLYTYNNYLAKSTGGGGSASGACQNTFTIQPNNRVYTCGGFYFDTDCSNDYIYTYCKVECYGYTYIKQTGRRRCY